MLNKRKPGQGLAEFALVAPILLLLIMGIFDFGRVFFSYAMASNALRSALRNAAVYGYGDGENNYLNCALMEETIEKTFFVGTPTINIRYESAVEQNADGTPVTWPCSAVDPTQGGNPDVLETGDMLKIDIANSIQLITPLISQIAPNLTFEFQGQRTVVTDIRLTTRASGDVDYDGLDDAWEALYFSAAAAARGINPNQVYNVYTGSDDPDSDGCNNGCEQANLTDPTNPNSDALDLPNAGDPGDLLNDGDEVFRYRTKPLDWDTDDDLLSDSDEVIGRNVTVVLPDMSTLSYLMTSNPLDGDSDDDLLSDGEEVLGVAVAINMPNGTILNVMLISNPKVVDSDTDGLTDYQEVHGYVAANGSTYYSNPLSGDSDSDGLSDYDEVTGNNANHYYTNPYTNDSDNDGLTDLQEVTGFTITDWQNLAHPYFSNPTLADSDSDQLTDIQELLGYVATNGTRYFSDPLESDSDGDGLSDYDEVTGYNLRLAVTDPLNSDGDGDGLSDYYEVRFYGTDPNNINSDGPNSLYSGYPGDTLTDYQEKVTFWSNPNQWDTFVSNCADNLAVIGQCGDGITYGGLFDNDGDGLPDSWEMAYLFTRAYGGLDDPDNDGCNNVACEYPLSTDPLDADTDNDGLMDGPEFYGVNINGTVVTYNVSPFNPDTDGDGLMDGQEVYATYGYLTDPTVRDTDGDTIKDGDEVLGYRTANGTTYTSNPTSLDSDGDTIPDRNELLGNTAANGSVYITNPANSDSDGDGLGDGAEQSVHRTNPLLADSDTDNVTDYEEVYGYLAANNATYTSVPSDSDSDDDGLLDGAEVKATAQYVSNPNMADTDSDVLSDAQEVNGVTVTTQVGVRTFRSYPRSADSDGDLLTDAQEVMGYTASSGAKYYSDPLLTDSDGDNLSDYHEARGTFNYITDNLKADTDGDGLNDGYEVNTSLTNPLVTDTDGDGVNDGTDAYPGNVPTVSIGNITNVSRAAGVANFPVTVMYGNAGQSLTINYHTVNGTALCDQIQQNRHDYTCVPLGTGLRTYTPSANGTTTTTIPITTEPGRSNSANEYFDVVLESVATSNPTGTAVLGGTTTGRCTYNP